MHELIIINTFSKIMINSYSYYMVHDMFSINPLLNELTGEQAFALIAKAREVQKRKGIKVISFGVGQPDFDTFPHIKEAAKKALDEGFTGYTEAAGIPELRKAIADYLNESYNAGVTERNIVVTTGAKTAILLAIGAVASGESEIIIPEPTYYAYSQAAKIFGAHPVFVPMEWSRERGFKINIDKLIERVTPKTRAIVINNPNNPTGTVYDKRDVERLLEVARENNIALISDEVYERFVYNGNFTSIASFDDWLENSILINSFSKTFSMTGWRLGYVVAHERITERLVSLAVNTYSCAPSFVQKAGIAALKGDWTPVYEMIKEFKERRDLLYKLLSEIPGFEPNLPEGAFYMFPRIQGILQRASLSEEEFSDKLLEEAGVVVVPGTAFPDKAGKGYVRFSYATSKQNIIEGVNRIKEFLEKNNYI
jgi:aspartate aminotransferase